MELMGVNLTAVFVGSSADNLKNVNRYFEVF
jgi:hypothetical protein